MAIPDLEAKRARVRMGIWRVIWTIVAIDAVLLLRMCGAL